jgi:hypothetical protein
VAQRIAFGGLITLRHELFRMVATAGRTLELEDSRARHRHASATRSTAQPCAGPTVGPRKDRILNRHLSPAAPRSGSHPLRT